MRIEYSKNRRENKGERREKYVKNERNSHSRECENPYSNSIMYGWAKPQPWQFDYILIKIVILIVWILLAEDDGQQRLIFTESREYAAKTISYNPFLYIFFSIYKLTDKKEPRQVYRKSGS